MIKAFTYDSWQILRFAQNDKLSFDQNQMSARSQIEVCEALQQGFAEIRHNPYAEINFYNYSIYIALEYLARMSCVYDCVTDSFIRAG